jgi:hypothetical protein
MGRGDMGKPVAWLVAWESLEFLTTGKRVFRSESTIPCLPPLLAPRQLLDLEAHDIRADLLRTAVDRTTIMQNEVNSYLRGAVDFATAQNSLFPPLMRCSARPLRRYPKQRPSPAGHTLYVCLYVRVCVSVCVRAPLCLCAPWTRPNPVPPNATLPITRARAAGPVADPRFQGRPLP